jgi:hypothetical protein
MYSDILPLFRAVDVRFPEAYGTVEPYRRESDVTRYLCSIRTYWRVYIFITAEFIFTIASGLNR